MKKLMLLLTATFLLLSLVAFTGCGDRPAEDAAKDAEAPVVATHDCDGGCGMKAMAADQTTEVDGKFYCAGCAAKAKGDHPEGHDSHEGHNH